MNTAKTLLSLSVCALALCSCSKVKNDGPIPSGPQGLISPRGIAGMLARLPLGQEQLNEVFDAVNSSSGNGYDEEYMMRDLLECPGAGVGDSPDSRAAGASAYSTPLRDLISDYLGSQVATRAGAPPVEEYLRALSESGMQIYWPYSEEWDGTEYPLITFDPGFGATTNYAYKVSMNPDGEGPRIVDSVLVSEAVAQERPVWVVNNNSDSAFTPLDMFTRSSGTSDSSGRSSLYLASFQAKRQFDPWFAGGSEFFIKCGSVAGLSFASEEELRLYNPEVTDLMIVVRRRDVGKVLPLNALLLSGVSDQIEKVAFLLTESDGGTRTEWKCEAAVKIKSKSYGFDISLPFFSSDDIVWRGQLDLSYLREVGRDEATLGDVVVDLQMR